MLSPEWVATLGGLVLGAARFGYDVLKDHRAKNAEDDNDEGHPPAASAA